MKKIVVVLFLIAALIFATPGMAQAHHTKYQSLHVAKGTLKGIDFADAVNAKFTLQASGRACCFTKSKVRVPHGYDIMITSRERPTWRNRVPQTGWYNIRALDNPGHLTFSVVRQGA